MRVFFKALEVAHIQLDELWANAKQTRQEVWVACDVPTKIVPVRQLRARIQAMVCSVVHKLKSRLKAVCVPVFNTDGLKHYFHALTAHFGEWIRPEGETKDVWRILASLLYAQVIQHQKRYRLVDVEHRIIWGEKGEYRSQLKAAGLSENINTSFVQRINLTIRQCVCRNWHGAVHS
jgi:hypothetical protein